MLFKLTVIVVVLVLVAYECSLISNDNNFSLKYNCSLIENNKSIKCSNLNKTVTHIQIQLSTSVVDLDLSNNSLETLTFTSNTILNKLMLNNNKFKQINEHFFANLSSLNQLDLSHNCIEKMNEMTFETFHLSLISLNLSKAFVDSYVFTRELCELMSLKVVDLSYLNLNNFTLKCWSSSSPGQIEELYARNTRNIDKSWSEWLPFIGIKLKRIDLTNSNLKTIDATLNKPLLAHLILANNQQIDKTDLHKLLSTDNLIGRLTTLNLANTTVSSESFEKIIDSSNSSILNLNYLDLSFNNFTDDLNVFLFNQPKLKKLKSFRASNNKFNACNSKLDTINNKSLLENLQELDLSFNKLNGVKCLYSIKTVVNLRVLNLSHNKLNAIESDLVDLIDFFANMFNVTSIDFSYNSFVWLGFYFNENHTKIDKFDLSRNNLKQFRFISKTRKDSAKFPNNIIGEFHDYVDFDDDNNADETDDLSVAVDNKHDSDDDDERFVLIDDLNLSFNNFNQIDLQHMLQSIRNVKNLDLSNNPLSKLVGLSDTKLLIKNDVIEQDDFTEILCIDQVDFSFCKLEYLPNLEHVCINKLNFAYNQLNKSYGLFISNFSTYFIDYINLQYNDIKHLSVKAMSNQVFKQDYYKHKNSPISYYFGEVNSSNLVHTYVDLQNNKNYKCNCDEIVNLKETYFIQIVNECLRDPAFKQQCTEYRRVTIYSLNKKFRVLFVITCGLLLLLSGLIVYYMCSDCIRNMQPYEMIRFNLRQILNRLRDLKRYRFTTSEETSSNVVYSKLDNDLIASTNNININNNNNNNEIDA